MVTGEAHYDGGRLRRSTAAHPHVAEREDGSMSAVLVRGVPALICDLCEETYYEQPASDTIVGLLEQVPVPPERGGRRDLSLW
jgi:hypothetical protein